MSLESSYSAIVSVFVIDAVDVVYSAVDVIFSAADVVHGAVDVACIFPPSFLFRRERRSSG